MPYCQRRFAVARLIPSSLQIGFHGLRFARSQRSRASAGSNQRNHNLPQVLGVTLGVVRDGVPERRTQPAPENAFAKGAEETVARAADTSEKRQRGASHEPRRWRRQNSERTWT